MPELPEVENTAKYLRTRIKGSVIQSVDVCWEKTIQNCAAQSFKRKLRGVQILEIWRRGKFLIFDLGDLRTKKPLFMLAHLRMSGSFRVSESKEASKKHDRVKFTLDKGEYLSFHDIRKFGRLYLVEDHNKITKNLGPEPLSDKFSPELLKQTLNRRSPLKALLLRQDLIAGIGNIYADEALWHSLIHPLQPGCTLKTAECERLHQSIREVLKEAIVNQGTNFGDKVVEYGLHQPSVYGRSGKPCRRCKKAIRRIVITQRSSHFCPACQKLKKRVLSDYS